jgi:hypothetical protein
MDPFNLTMALTLPRSIPPPPPSRGINFLYSRTTYNIRHTTYSSAIRTLTSELAWLTRNHPTEALYIQILPNLTQPHAAIYTFPIDPPSEIVEHFQFCHSDSCIQLNYHRNSPALFFDPAPHRSPPGTLCRFAPHHICPPTHQILLFPVHALDCQRLR